MLNEISIEKSNIKYVFLDLNKNLDYGNFIKYIEANNIIYNIPTNLFIDFTGVIKIYQNNLLTKEIKVYEGKYFYIRDTLCNVDFYMKDDLIQSKIYEYKKYNKIRIDYLYDRFIIKDNLDLTFNISYMDTCNNDFNLVSIEKKDLPIYQTNIIDKFNVIYLELKQEIKNYVDNIYYILTNM
jgi:hypothetical protein